MLQITSWVTTGLRRDLQSPLNIHVEQETWYHVPIERHGRPRPVSGGDPRSGEDERQRTFRRHTVPGR